MLLCTPAVSFFLLLSSAAFYDYPTVLLLMGIWVVFFSIFELCMFISKPLVCTSFIIATSRQFGVPQSPQIPFISIIYYIPTKFSSVLPVPLVFLITLM